MTLEPSRGLRHSSQHSNQERSSTLDRAEWNNTTVLTGDVAEAVSKLKREVAGVILVAGSARLVQALVEHDLVDELRLMTFPVILGHGKRLFGETSNKKPLRLVDSKLVGDGVAILTYHPVRDAAERSA